MHEAIILDAVRTPVGRRDGSLSSHHPVDLGAGVLTPLVERNGIDPALVDNVYWRCVSEAGGMANAMVLELLEGGTKS